VSLTVALAAALEMLVFYPAGHVMDRHGRRGVAVVSLLLMGGALLLMPLAQGTTALLVAAAVVGVGNGLSSGLVMTLGADHSPPAARAHFLGLWRLMSDIGSTCGPALLSALAALMTLGAGIAGIGLLGLLAAAQLGYWIPRAGQAGR
jgi:MFS family permease